MKTNWDTIIGKKFQSTKNLDWFGRYPEVLANGTITAIHDADAVPADLVMVDFVKGKFVETDGEQGFEALMAKSSVAGQSLGGAKTEKKAKASVENGKSGGAPTLWYRELKKLALDVVAQDGGGAAQREAIEALGRHLGYPGY